MSRGFQADINCKFEMMGFRLTPVLLAIQTFKPGSNLNIIKCLLANYADLNLFESQTGFNPLMMACHLNNEADALKIIQLLCEHKYYQTQNRLIDVNATDNNNYNVLHHATIAKKKSVVEYLLKMADLDKNHPDQDGLLPIDMCDNKDIEKMLSQYQTRSADIKKAKEGMFTKFKSLFVKKKKAANIDLMEFI